MKHFKHYSFIFAPLIIVVGLQATSSSKTFFRLRPIVNDALLAPSYNPQADVVEEEKGLLGFTLSKTFFYQQSIEGQGLSDYFMPTAKRQLEVKGATAPGSPDISGTWLGIAGKNAVARTQELYLNDFESTLTINPCYNRFGMILQAHRIFPHLSQKVWLSITAPFVQIETNMRLNETAIKNNYSNRSEVHSFELDDNTSGSNIVRYERATALVTNLDAEEAFDDKVMLYGKINNQKQKKSGLADLKLAFGAPIIDKQTVQVDLYGVFTVPMDYKPTADYLFEPIVGNGGHLGLGSGLNMHAYVVNHYDKQWLVQSSLEGTYLFNALERRSFDLKNGAWSRYLLVYESKNDQNTAKPGINFFTQDLLVTPGFGLEWNNAVVLKHGSWAVKTGYNMYWKSAEDVKRFETWDSDIATACIELDPQQPFLITSASTATIADHYNNTTIKDSGTVLISEADFNLDSATTDASMHHKIFCSFEYDNFYHTYPIHVAVGGAYQFTRDIVSLDEMTVWATMSIAL